MNLLLGAAIGTTVVVRADILTGQALLDHWCNAGNCHPTHCNGPVGTLLARRSGPKVDGQYQFRCYSERSLYSNNRTWSGEDHCYCTRDSELKSLIYGSHYNNMPSKCKAMMQNFCNTACYPRIKDK